jgi:hypothetical protein
MEHRTSNLVEKYKVDRIREKKKKRRDSSEPKREEKEKKVFNEI